MLFGQLIHYDKLLREFNWPLTADNLNSLDLMGVELLDPELFQDSNPRNIANTVKDLFITNYLEVLKENNLEFAVNFWQNMTSPFKKDLNIIAKSEFQFKLVEWERDGYPSKELHSIVSEGFFTTTDTDYSIYYGLHVLELLNAEFNEFYDLHFAETSTSAELNAEPHSIIITSDFLAPLLVNLNCVYIPFNSVEILKSEIQETMSLNPSISLILLDELYTNIFDQIKKAFPNIVIATLNLTGDFSSHGFFDDIAKKTLGIRLE